MTSCSLITAGHAVPSSWQAPVRHRGVIDPLRVGGVADRPRAADSRQPAKLSNLLAGGIAEESTWADPMAAGSFGAFGFTRSRYAVRFENPTAERCDLVAVGDNTVLLSSIRVSLIGAIW